VVMTAPVLCAHCSAPVRGRSPAAEVWRMTIGLWLDEPDPIVHADALFPSWKTARDALAQQIRSQWLAPPDECGPCVRDAEVTLQELASAAVGRSFLGSIEGDDYMLRPQPLCQRERSVAWSGPDCAVLVADWGHPTPCVDCDGLAGPEDGGRGRCG
jgi:hypothetical protein